MNVIINLGNSLQFDPTFDGGGLNDDFFLSNEEAEWLLDGRTYINVHTKMYDTGEIRGYLLPADAIVPEPGAVPLASLLLVALAGHRKRRSWDRA